MIIYQTIFCCDRLYIWIHYIYFIYDIWCNVLCGGGGGYIIASVYGGGGLWVLSYCYGCVCIELLLWLVIYD